MALSTTSLTSAQQKQVLAYIAETAAAKSLTAQQIAELSIDQKQALIKAGLITQEQIETGVTLELSKAQLQKIITSDAISTKDKELILGAFGVTGANLTETSSWEVLGASIKRATAAMLKWLFLTPAGWATLAITAIVGTIVAYNKWGDTIENNRKKLEELKSEAQTISSDLQTFNRELQTTQQRISELESKGNLTFTEAEELENLRKQNNELQRSIDLLKLKEKENNKGKNKTFVKTMQKNVDVEDERVHTGRLNPDDTAETELITEAELIERKFNTLDELQEKLRQASTETEKKAIQEQIDKITKYLSECNEQYIEDAEGIDYIQNPTNDDDKKVNEWLDYINDFQDKMAVAMGEENAKENAFNRLVDNWKFDELLNPLQKLGKEGKVTAEKLKDPAYAEFISKLQEIGFIADDSTGSLKFVASAFNGTAYAARNYVNQLKGNEIGVFIDNLSDEAKALGVTENALAELVAEHILFNNTGIDTSSKQTAFIQLANVIGKTSDEIVYLIKLLNAAFDGTTLDLSDSMEPFSGVGGYRKNTILGDIQVDPRKILQERYGIGKEIYLPKKDNDTPPHSSSKQKDKSSSKDTFDDSYYSSIDAWLKENEKEIEKLKKEYESLNRQFENALDTGNKEQVEILRSKLAENAKAQKYILHRQNEAHRITQKDLLESLYQYAPSLSGKSWEEISEVDLVNIENELNNKAETSSDNNKKQAKYNLNQFKGIVSDLKNLNKVIEGNSQAWWEADENAKSYWQSQIDFQDDLSNTWVDNQKAFDKLTEEEELAAYGRMINNNKEFQKQILNDTSLSEESRLALIKEVNDKIVEIEKNTYDLRKDVFGKATDLGSSYYDSKKTLLQSYFDVTNSIAEAWHEIDKELETSKTMYEWLDKETQMQLFNQEDYIALSRELNEIQNEALLLKADYEDALDNATLDTIEKITSQYEMQYDMLMKSYEIAKADLEVAKKKQKLNNVLNERNVRMFINGQWQWVANTEDVANAKSELADAKYEAQQKQLQKEQTDSLNNLTTQQDQLGTIVNQFESGVIDLNTAIYMAEQAMRTIPSAVASSFTSIKSSTNSKSTTNSLPAGYNVTYRPSTDSKSTTNSLPAGYNVTYRPSSSSSNSTSRIEAEGNVEYKPFAAGTRNTPSGNLLLGEEEPEIFIDNNGHLIPINQPTFGNFGAGGVVFNQDQMAGIRDLWDLSNLKIPNYNSLINKNMQNSIVTNDNSYHVYFQNLEIDRGIVDIDALKRFISTH